MSGWLYYEQQDIETVLEALYNILCVTRKTITFQIQTPKWKNNTYWELKKKKRNPHIQLHSFKCIHRLISINKTKIPFSIHIDILRSLIFHHIRRQGNKVAHSLPHAACNFYSFCTWLEEVPVCSYADYLAEIINIT